MDEEEYTQSVVVPLLIRMGFSEVSYNHGIAEFGKDVLFAEHDKFGRKRYFAAQVKVGDISGGSKGQINDLIGHALNALNQPFPDLVTKQDQRIIELFIVISGRFTNNAVAALLHDDRLSQFRHRIHVYEGRHIEEFTKRSYQEIKNALQAGHREMASDIGIADRIPDHIANDRVSRHLETTDLSRAISALSTDPHLVSFAEELDELRALMRNVNRNLDFQFMLGFDDEPGKPDPRRAAVSKQAKAIVEKTALAMKKAQQLLSAP